MSRKSLKKEKEFYSNSTKPLKVVFTERCLPDITYLTPHPPLHIRDIPPPASRYDVISGRPQRITLVSVRFAAMFHGYPNLDTKGRCYFREETVLHGKLGGSKADFIKCLSHRDES